MTKTIEFYYIVFDNDTDMKLFNPDDFKIKFDDQQEAFDIAVKWKKATGHNISLKCIYTREAEVITL